MGSSARSATISTAAAVPSATTMRSSGFSLRRTTSEVLDNELRRFVAPRGNFVSRKNSLVLLRKGPSFRRRNDAAIQTRQYKKPAAQRRCSPRASLLFFFGDNGGGRSYENQAHSAIAVHVR